MKPLRITQKNLWPPRLLYWRRMSSTQITNYLKRMPVAKRLVLVVWGVLEAHGPFLPTANDSLFSAVVADYIADRLYRERKIQPIIFNSFQDVGSPSATWEFPGAIGYTAHPVPVIQAIWEQTLVRMEREGFKKFFVINGDGGNWRNHWGQLKWDNATIRQLVQEKGVTFEGANWDQEGGTEGHHAGTHPHALATWMCNLAPDFIRFSALRHGCVAPVEGELKTIDGVSMTFMEDDPYVFSDWSQYERQNVLRSVQEFNLKQYREFLSKPKSSLRAKTGIEIDFEAKMEHLFARVVKVL